MAEDNPQMKSDAKLVQSASQLPQSQMRVWFPKRFNQRRNGFENLVLNRLRE